MKVGDTVWLDGKKYEVTYVDGRNFSYKPFKKKEEPKKEPKEEPKKKKGKKA